MGLITTGFHLFLLSLFFSSRLCILPPHRSRLCMLAQTHTFGQDDDDDNGKKRRKRKERV